MNKDLGMNYKEQYEACNAWKDARRLTIEMQQVGYAKYIMEEAFELADAIAKGDLHGIVDACSDINVFTINSCKEYPQNEPFEKLSETPCFVDVSNEVKKYIESGYQGNHAKNIYVLLHTIVERYGYDFSIAMAETMREISSRTGEWCDDAKKFIKDPGAYTLEQIKEKFPDADDIEDRGTYFLVCKDGGIFDELTKWYKADYAKAKL